MPQIPGTSAIFSLSGAIAKSQVEVPMIFTSVPGVMPEPTAPRCTSNAPTATGMPAFSPSRFGPGFRKRAGLIGNGEHFFRQRFAHSLQPRIERFQKFHIRISTPFGVEKRFVPGRAHARVSLATA